MPSFLPLRRITQALAPAMAAALTFSAISALSGCGKAPAHLSADNRLKDIYTREWQWRQEQFADGEDVSRGISDHLPKVDAASQQMRLQHWEEVLKQLAAIPVSDLSEAQRENLEVYRPQIETLVASQRFRDYEMPANSDSTFWTDIGYTARRPFRNPNDYHNWIAQMRDIPRYFHEQMDEMRAGLKRGFTPPRITMTGRDASVTVVTDAAPEATLFYVPFKEMPGVAPAEQERLRAQAVQAIREVVQPAYRELLNFLRQEYIPGCRTTLAAEDLPDGKAYYRAKIREFTTLDMDPEAIHALGLKEVERLHQEMLDAMKETGFNGDFRAFQAMLRTDPRFYPKSADDLLMHAAFIAKRFDGKASQFFGLLPRARFAIEPVPDDLAPFYTAGRGGQGVYLVNTYALNTRPLYNLTALTLHESAPGHAFQIPLAREHEGQPDFRRSTYISAYGEGWALYCEWLGQEMGMYQSPYDRFGMLGYQIWRAARLVIDTGIHAKGWTREQAQAYLRQYSALPDHEIETEVDRYIAWPGQALSYYLGERAILDARQKAERELGTRFNLRAFHDTVLDLGSVPLPVLQSRIERFINQGGKGPYPQLE